MSANASFGSPGFREELLGLRRNWGWVLLLGAGLMAVGLLAIAYPVAATITTVELFGILLLVGGVLEITGGFWALGWRGFFLHLLAGLLYLFLGVMLVERPGLGAAAYTMLLAVFFVASGSFRIVFALSQRFPGWGWMLAGGVVGVLLGLMIWRSMPEAAFWVIGTFLGIDFLFNGCSWVMVALAARAAVKETPAEAEMHHMAKV